MVPIVLSLLAAEGRVCINFLIKMVILLLRSLYHSSFAAESFTVSRLQGRDKMKVPDLLTRRC
jgi:hypothetical protein